MCFTMFSQFIAITMATNTQGFTTLLSSLREILAFTWDTNTILYVFPQPFLIPPINNESTFFTKDETRTHTLIDVVVNPTHVNLFP